MTQRQVLTFGLLAENQRLSEATAAYHKLTERLQAEKVALAQENQQLRTALENILVWMGEGTRRGRPLDMMSHSDYEFYVKPARTLLGEKVSE